MTNILVMCLEPIPSAIAGVLKPLKSQEPRGFITVVFKKTCQIRKSDLDKCDALICVRGSEKIELKIIKACKDAGKFCVYYLDDDLLAIPDFVGSAEYFANSDVASNIKNIIKECDCLWTTNPNIAKKYSSFCQRVVITKGPALLLGTTKKQKNDQIIRVGFAGSTDYAKCIDNILRVPLLEISGKYGDKISFEFLGAKPQIIKELKNAKYFPYIENPEEYALFMESCQWDIGLAPLPDGEFFRCKYFNKFLEYGASGIAGIYSKVEPFLFIVEHGINGFLCENTNDSWIEAITELIENEKLRQDIIDNARTLLKQNFTVDAVGNEIVEKIPELINTGFQIGSQLIFLD